MVARVAISVAGMTALLVYLGLPNGFRGTVMCLAYVLVGTFLRPEPDMSDLGWLGGLIDQPFRISDDINRALLFLLLVLWPGRVIGSGFLLLFRSLVASRRS